MTTQFGNPTVTQLERGPQDEKEIVREGTMAINEVDILCKNMERLRERLLPLMEDLDSNNKIKESAPPEHPCRSQAGSAIREQRERLEKVNSSLGDMLIYLQI